MICKNCARAEAKLLEMYQSNVDIIKMTCRLNIKIDALEKENARLHDMVEELGCIHVNIPEGCYPPGE